MIRPRLFLTFLIGAALVAPMANAAGTTAVAATTGPTLVGIRAAHHPGYDRVVFDFTGGLPSIRSVGYVSPLIADPSGLPVQIAGRAILKVTVLANAHNNAGQSTAPARVSFVLPNVMNVVRSGDFEAVTSYGIGLAKRETFTVFTLRNPSRVVIDVRSAFPTVMKRVWLFNQKRYLANTQPFYTPVWRPVQPFTPATGVMDRIFAGPSPAEYSSGLRALLSRATGFSNLTISGGIARVRLTGGCSANGSTVSIAGEIRPSLKQFPTVSHVKIYDPSGHTLRPTGPVDSIPYCLEP
jgi:hypothetical protein